MCGRFSCWPPLESQHVNVRAVAQDANHTVVRFLEDWVQVIVERSVAAVLADALQGWFAFTVYVWSFVVARH